MTKIELSLGTVRKTGSDRDVQRKRREYQNEGCTVISQINSYIPLDKIKLSSKVRPTATLRRKFASF
jgi:hypothetical protein